MGQVGTCQHWLAYFSAWQKRPHKQGPCYGLAVGLPGVSPICWVTRRADHFSVQKMDPVLGSWCVPCTFVPRIVVVALCRMCQWVLSTHVSRDIRAPAVWLSAWCSSSLRYIAMENGTGCLESADGASQKITQAACATAASSSDDAGARCRTVKEVACNSLVGTPSKGTSALLEQIEALRATQRELKAHKKRVAVEMKNAMKRKKRLKGKASQLTDDDLVEVLRMRQASSAAPAADESEAPMATGSSSSA